MTDKERIDELVSLLVKAKADNQEIMKINNQLRVALLDIKSIATATVK